MLLVLLLATIQVIVELLEILKTIICSTLIALPVFENLTELRGLSDTPIFLSSVSCEGSEESLLQCKFTLPAGLYIPSLCYSTVGLECQGIVIH